MAEMRLQRYLAQAGVAARRKAERLITDGVVRVNGKVVTVLGTKIDPATDNVTVKGSLVEPEELCYVLLNKPKGCITAVSDPQDRPTVMDYLYGLPSKVVPVGRLDYYTEGVLLLTNDGDLSAALQSPKSDVEKTYHVKLRGKIHKRDIDRLREGVRLDDGYTTRPAKVDQLRTKSSHDWLVISIHEGKTRQIHRMMEAVGFTVTKLQRVAFAGIAFHGLRVGDARQLKQSEVDSLRDLVGLEPDRRARSSGGWQVKREQTESGRRLKARARKESGATYIPSARALKAAAGVSNRKSPAGRKSSTASSTRTKPARTTGKPKRGPATPKRGPAKAKRGPAKAKRGPAKAKRGPAKPKRAGAKKPSRKPSRRRR